MKYLQTYRLHPTPEQAAAIRERFALAGAAYNWGLAETERVWSEEKRHLSLFDIKDVYRRHFNYGCHRTISACELNALNNLDCAYSYFFENRANKPRMKEQERMVSYTEMASAVLPRTDSRHLYLPNVGRVPCNFYRPIQHQPTQVTVKERDGRFFAVLLTDLPEQPRREEHPDVVGIDLGLKTFATLSDGKEIHFPSHIWDRRAERREAHLQRVNKRRTEGSNRQKKAARRYARYMEHKANQVKDFHCKTAVRLCRDYGAIAVEHLAVESMKQGHGCKKRNNDFNHYGLTAFIRCLKNRCVRTGTEFLQIGRYEPTTRRCHCCGYLLPKALPLEQREWTCPICHQTHQRDLNAALNIQALGQRLLQTRPAADGVVTSVEQSERTCCETEKVTERSAASPKEEQRHSVSHLALKKTRKPAPLKQGGKRSLTPEVFLAIVTDVIQPAKVAELTGRKMEELAAYRRNGIGIDWRKEMMQERCELLRLMLIDGLQQNLPDFMTTPPKQFVEQFTSQMSEWLRITELGKRETILQLPITHLNRYAWHLYVQTLIRNLKNINIIKQ